MPGFLGGTILVQFSHNPPREKIESFKVAFAYRFVNVLDYWHQTDYGNNPVNGNIHLLIGISDSNYPLVIRKKACWKINLHRRMILDCHV